MAKSLDPFINVDGIEPSRQIEADPIMQSRINQGEVQDGIMYSTARPSFRAIVGEKAGHGVDFTDIQKAIDYVQSMSLGGTVFVRSGTYYPTNTITIPDNISLQGEDEFSTILDFSVNGCSDGGISLVGSGISITGSITATYNSATITGSSTTFQTNSVVAGDVITINGLPYTVASVASNTSLTLVETYKGATLSGIPCRIYRPKKNISVSHLNITGTSGSSETCIKVTYTQNVKILNNILEDAADGLYINNPFNFQIRNNIIRGNGADGINIYNMLGTGIIQDNFIFNNSGAGISIGGFSADNPIFIRDNSICANAVYGLYLNVAHYIIATSNNISANKNHGVLFNGAKDNILMNNHIMNNGDDGVHLQASGGNNSEQNTVIGNYIASNVGHGYELTSGGNNNLVNHNYNVNNGTNALNNGTGNNTWDNWA